jgi:hypothetical protein
MTKIGKKAAQDFFGAVSKVVDRVKTVALWSAKKYIYIYIKDHKGLRFRSYFTPTCILIFNNPEAI